MKRLVRNAVSKLIQEYRKTKLPYSVIVAGLGRCGTTLLFDACRRAVSNEALFVVDLERHTFGNQVIKTHDHPPDLLPSDTKVIFMYGDVINTVVSTTAQINDWGTWHFRHMHATTPFPPYEQLYFEDQLGLETQFDAWYCSQPFDLMTVRYESLYKPETIGMLRAFTGINLRLPAYRPRKTDGANHSVAPQLRRVYRSLISKIDEAADCKVWPRV